MSKRSYFEIQQIEKAFFKVVGEYKRSHGKLDITYWWTAFEKQLYDSIRKRKQP